MPIYVFTGVKQCGVTCANMVEVTWLALCIGMVMCVLLVCMCYTVCLSLMQFGHLHKDCIFDLPLACTALPWLWGERTTHPRLTDSFKVKSHWQAVWLLFNLNTFQYIMYKKVKIILNWVLLMPTFTYTFCLCLLFTHILHFADVS